MLFQFFSQIIHVQQRLYLMLYMQIRFCLAKYSWQRRIFRANFVEENETQVLCLATLLKYVSQSSRQLKKCYEYILDISYSSTVTYRTKSQLRKEINSCSIQTALKSELFYCSNVLLDENMILKHVLNSLYLFHFG